MTDDGRRLQRQHAMQPPVASSRGLAALMQELQARLRRHFPASALTLDGRLKDWRDNLLLGVDPKGLPRRRGLELQLRQVESPLALTFNSFLPWCEWSSQLELAGASGFSALHFLLLCPTGARGTPPTVTALARGPTVVVAIEVASFAYLRRPERRLAAGYQSLPLPTGLIPWQRLLSDADSGRTHIRHLSLPRLFKLALALERNFVNAERWLLYLFLEPPGEAARGPFAQHRRELAWLATRTRPSSVRFAYAPFSELWQRWETQAPTPQLRELARALLARYHTSLTARAGPVLVPLVDD